MTMVNQGLLVLVVMSAVNGDVATDYSSFEFGRKTSSSSPGLSEVEVLLRELIEVEAFSMSMSMSMDMTVPSPTPSPAPVGNRSPTEGTFTPTTEITLNDGIDTTIPRVGCDEQIQSVVTLLLEVETAIGKESYTNDVADALKKALANEYDSCAFPRRRLEDGVSILLGDVTLTEEQNTVPCAVRSPLADQCRTARADIIVASEANQDLVRTIMKDSTENILEFNDAFDVELLLEGVVDVRVAENAQTTPNGARGAEAQISSGSPATTAVISVAAVGALILALVAARRRGPKDYVDIDAVKEDSVFFEPDRASYAETFIDTAPESSAVPI